MNTTSANAQAALIAPSRMSDEGQRFKAALAQLTVEGGAPEEKSGKADWDRGLWSLDLGSP